MSEKKVHWKPHPGKQEAALAFEDVDEKLYGGGRGGGKTDAGQAWMVHPDYIKHPRYRGLVIRQNATDLTDWIDRARTMYLPLKPTFKGNPGEIHFPSGAVIRTGHLKDAGSYQKYQGHEYQRVLIEEASHIPDENLYEKLMASCRSTIQELRPRKMLTSNPDGDGGVWLKKRFKIKPGSAIQHFVTEHGETRMYIPSTVDDNPSLLKDTQYVRFLDSLTDPDLKAAWRQGDWDAFKVKGSYYADLLAIAKKEGRVLRFNNDPRVRMYTYWDMGMNDSMVVLFVQFVGREVWICDMIEYNGEGLAYYAKEILNRPYAYGGHFLPHDAQVREQGTGKSRKEVLEGLLPHPIEVLPNLPINDGVQAVRNMFNRLYINEGKCQRAIDALEIYRKEWIPELQTYRDQAVHDWSSHIADAVRYLAVAPEPTSMMRTQPTTNDIYAAI